MRTIESLHRAEERELLTGSPPSIAPRAPRAGLSPLLIHVLTEVQRELSYRFESSPGIVSAVELEELIEASSHRLGVTLTRVERDEVLKEIEHEQLPFGSLQPLIDDPLVSDVIVSSASHVSVQQGRNNYTTAITFPSDEAYESFVERLLLKAGTTYSTKKPLADGMIGSEVRLHAVHRSLCEAGPYLTLRINRFRTVTREDLILAGLAPKEVFLYLERMVLGGRTVFLAGEVGTGKTTLARALASSVPTEESILVIEDTPEIRLDHPHVRYLTTREANSEGVGRVSPSECIRAGMRMAMNRIIFGEIRDPEAAEAFIDVCASGHPGLSTIHSRSAAEACARLQLFLGRAQRGASATVLAEQVATAVQVVVFIGLCKESARRRIMEVVEIGPVADGTIRHREIFRYQCQDERPRWKVSNKLSAHRALLEGVEPKLELSKLSVLEVR